MATVAELQDALVNADRAGDTEAARRLADAIVSAKQVQEAKPAAAQAGDTLREAGRQVGLTARYALEGVPQALEIFTEPIRNNITDPLSRLVLGPKNTGDLITGKTAPQGAPLGQAGSDFANWLGLPKPAGANERVIGDMTRLGFGAMGFAGGANRLAALAQPGTTQNVLTQLAAKPGQQVAAAAGAGGAGGAVREAGGGPGAQALAALTGGVAGGLSLSGATSIANNLTARLNPRMTAQQVEQQITLTLQGSGIDWNAIPERVKQGMRAEVTQALRTGQQLNGDAVRRLLDFQRTGTTPTKGMLSQDPAQITRERNLAKVGANSGDIGLQRLSRLENENTGRLLQNLDDLGARNAPDDYAAGQAGINALSRLVDRSRTSIDRLYDLARDTQGRSAELSRADFATAANRALDDAMVGGKLPASVSGVMNRIATGEMPFTVDVAEQLKTRIGDLQRATTDGQERMALGLVRRALDNTPLQSGQAAGGESIQAFNRARAANRAFMERVESSPALEAVYRGIREGRPLEPDNFVRRFIIGGGASVADVRQLQRAATADPQAMQAIRQNIAAHLRSAATGGTEDVTRFSAQAYNRALTNIGERKLAAFFSPEEIEQLRSVGRAGSLMQAQPAGAAVNNSNSGALLLGRGLEVLDAFAGKLPFGADTTINGVVRGLRTREALNVRQSLLPRPNERNRLAELIGPATVYGGSLAPQLVDHP